MRYNSEMDTYTTGQLASLFSVNTETIRRWTKEFTRHLSVQATPGNSRTRLFNDEDVSVLALVANMKTSRATFEDIHAALDSGQRGEIEFPEPSSVTVPSDRIQQQLVHLQNELEMALIEAGEFREENARLSERNKELTRRAENAEARAIDLTNEVMKLQRELGRMEGQLGTYRVQEDEHPKS